MSSLALYTEPSSYSRKNVLISSIESSLDFQLEKLQILLTITRRSSVFFANESALFDFYDLKMANDGFERIKEDNGPEKNWQTSFLMARRSITS